MEPRKSTRADYAVCTLGNFEFSIYTTVRTVSAGAYDLKIHSQGKEHRRLHDIVCKQSKLDIYSITIED